MRRTGNMIVFTRTCISNNDPTLGSANATKTAIAPTIHQILFAFLLIIPSPTISHKHFHVTVCQNTLFHWRKQAA
jgi:hypothetical protein